MTEGEGSGGRGANGEAQAPPLGMRAGTAGRPPGDDAGHAMLTVAGAVDAQSGQEVKQMGREVLIKLADGGLEAGGQLRRVRVLRQVLEDTARQREPGPAAPASSPACLPSLPLLCLRSRVSFKEFSSDKRHKVEPP